MTYRIQRSTNDRGVTFFLIGEVDGSLVSELEVLMTAESNRLVFLDLADVTLANREAVTFLALPGSRFIFPLGEVLEPHEILESDFIDPPGVRKDPVPRPRLLVVELLQLQGVGVYKPHC